MKTINENELIKYIYNKTEIEPDMIKKILDLELDYLRNLDLVSYKRTRPLNIKDFINETIQIYNLLHNKYKQYKNRKQTVN